MGTATPRFGGYFHSFPQGGRLAVVERAEQASRRRIHVVMWYQQWRRLWQRDRSQPTWIAAVGARDVLIKWEPRRVLARPTRPTASNGSPPPTTTVLAVWLIRAFDERARIASASALAALTAAGNPCRERLITPVSSCGTDSRGGADDRSGQHSRHQEE